MVEHLGQHAGGHGGDMRAHLGGGDDVLGMAHRGHQDLGLERVVLAVNVHDVRDQPHAVAGDIVEAADEGRDEGRARLGRQDRLGRREAEGDVDHGAAVGERPAGLEPVRGERHLDRDVGGDLGELLALLKHGGVIGGGDLGAHRPAHHRADLGHDLEELPARLGDERGVGRHPVHQPAGRERPDFVDVGGIEEELHAASPCLTERGTRRRAARGSGGAAGALDRWVDEREAAAPHGEAGQPENRPHHEEHREK